MRDALGALGPVDGINPELSNLTISVTTIQKGDIVMVATDGLTDNFDPNVCKFTVNTTETIKPKTGVNKSPQKRLGNGQPLIPENRILTSPKIEAQKPPIKPPRRSKTRELPGQSSIDRGSVKSNSTSEKSSSPSVENIRGDVSPSDQPTKTVNVDEVIHEVRKTERSSDSQKNQADMTVVESRIPVGGSDDKVPVDMDNPLVAQFIRVNSLDESPKTNLSKSKLMVSFLSSFYLNSFVYSCLSLDIIWYYSWENDR